MTSFVRLDLTESLARVDTHSHRSLRIAIAILSDSSREGLLLRAVMVLNEL